MENPGDLSNYQHFQAQMFPVMQNDVFLQEKEIVYLCGDCKQKVAETDEGIYCEAGCDTWYHRDCVGLTLDAYQALSDLPNAQWACDKCISTNTVHALKKVKL